MGTSQVIAGEEFENTIVVTNDEDFTLATRDLDTKDSKETAIASMLYGHSKSIAIHDCRSPTICMWSLKLLTLASGSRRIYHHQTSQ
jgi:hypothetical protein